MPREVSQNQARAEVDKMIWMLLEHMDSVEMVEGTLCPDHARICLRIVPKYGVDKVVGKISKRFRGGTCRSTRFSNRFRLVFWASSCRKAASSSQRLLS